MAERYNPTEIEAKWQERWEAEQLYRMEPDPSKPKWYALTMFPYTSGDLHCGHWYAMGPSDVQARYKRMKGHSVFFPIGFDSFGLPAENAAIQRGIHPRTWTLDNVVRMRGQLKSIGAMFDWSHEVITCMPEYYRWNQWFFLQFFKKGLAYRTKAAANWCPTDKTVLANEQVMADGTCERCHTPVTKRDLDQWFFKITQYADELLDFTGLEWPERVKTMQANWIGKSYGAEVTFPLVGATASGETEIKVFTTRPDTIYGATFMVLAPEHPLVQQITTAEQKSAIDTYINDTKRRTDIERLSTVGEKHGVFTGAYCINRFTNQPIPIYIADYVLMHYGTGAVMAVPAHDTRDFDFATKYQLPIVRVIAPLEWQGQDLKEAYTESGVMVNSGEFNGLTSTQFLDKVKSYIEEQGWGSRKVSYRLRDWLVSRQRYWGTPIPIIYCTDCGAVPVPEDQLPVELPVDAEFKPTGESPLNYLDSFVNTTCPQCGKAARRETDTMDTFVDSSWYQMRYLSPDFEGGPFDATMANEWYPVDQYTGGAEHATMHLLYARFFHKVVRDLGLVDSSEPYVRLFNQGQILGPDGQRMSKSRGNVVAPDPIVAKYGADAFRAYVMFLGPWDQGGPYNTDGINGVARWINRVWNVVLDTWSASPKPLSDKAVAAELTKAMHKAVQRVDEDLAGFHFNTMLAALMEFTNYLVRPESKALHGSPEWNSALETLMLMMAPSTPHVAEELWAQTGHGFSIHQQSFPTWDESMVTEDEVTLVVQVNGKVRDKLTVPASATKEQAVELAMASDKVKGQLDGKSIAQVIYVPGRLVNLVVR